MPIRENRKPTSASTAGRTSTLRGGGPQRSSADDVVQKSVRCVVQKSNWCRAEVCQVLQHVEPWAEGWKVVVLMSQHSRIRQHVIKDQGRLNPTVLMRTWLSLHMCEGSTPQSSCGPGCPCTCVKAQPRGPHADLAVPAHV